MFVIEKMSAKKVRKSLFSTTKITLLVRPTYIKIKNIFKIFVRIASNSLYEDRSKFIVLSMDVEMKIRNLYKLLYSEDTDAECDYSKITVAKSLVEYFKVLSDINNDQRKCSNV